MKLPFAATALLIGAVRALECPSEYMESMSLHDGELTFSYAIVDSSVLCARLERDSSEGWIGLGISPTGTMSGGEAVIGVPDDLTVQKYNLSGDSPRVSAMPDEKQTLMLTSITQEGGKTIMEFAKNLMEDGEHEILTEGKNTFLYALGPDNTLGYHGTTRGPFSLDFAGVSMDMSSVPTPSGGGGSVGVGLARTVAPSPAGGRGEGSSTPAPAPSGAMGKSSTGTLILGAGAVAVWFGMM